MKKLLITVLLGFLVVSSYSQLDKYLLQYGGKAVVYEDNLVFKSEVLPIWLPGTGRYDTIHVNDSVYLKCITAGTIYKESTQAYGTWEFNFNSAAGRTNIQIIALESIFRQNGYTFNIGAGANNALVKSVSGSLTVLMDAVTYVSFSATYTVKIIRTNDGEFTLYIKGGSFGSSYQVIDPTGGTGTNPVTDNTFTTSLYGIIEADPNDRYTDVDTYTGINIVWTASQIDQHLSDLVDIYTATTPTSNLTINMLGNRFAIPNDGASNTYLTQLSTIFTNAGYTFTALINS